ncbi:hypothetical protein IGS68_31620 (plasmid) [Skermanella sp. TT6]|uniref:Uncharacterized protein n=1 Tax=Skermanella cutis TaxID=2775420 RepID=A0ABX7BIJ6_9PROT|nr:hypothetical protein [Skermanella sp. TT6]QQP93576.1 hypothetical protein IGS68_31620 [Skermanella sp. TT6]
MTGRPKPEILAQHIGRDFRATEILRAQGVFVLALDGVPVGLRRRNTLVDYPGPKYSRTVFTNAGHCYGLARKLNKLFKWNRFTVLHYPVAGEEGVFLSEGDYYYVYGVEPPPGFNG